MYDLSDRGIYRGKRKKIIFFLQKMVVKSNELKRVAACFFFAVLLGCQMGQESTVLEQLTGVWETTEPRYKDCSFEIQNDLLLFTNALNEVEINHIVDIEKDPDEEDTVYHVFYKDDKGQKFLLSLIYFKSSDGDVIKFKTQQDIEWTRRLENKSFMIGI